MRPRPKPRRLAAALPVLLATALLAGCGRGVPEIPAGSTRVLVEAKRVAEPLPPGPAGFPGIPVRQRREPIDARWLMRPWVAHAVDRTSRTVSMSWEGGGCNDGYVVFVDERATQVILDVWEAPIELDDGEGCAAVGYPLSARVQLARPLGDRKLLKHRVEPTP